MMKTTSTFFCRTWSQPDQRTTSSSDARPRVGADLLKAAEWALALLLSVAVLSLLVVRAMHAGALWRDECAAVQLARMPTFNDVASNFQHEAFPLLFPATVRFYTSVFGETDIALRFFGLGVGVLLIAALWYNARQADRDVPLLSLGLLGLNTTFLVWGTSIRGYGLGCVLLIGAFGSTVGVLLSPSKTRVVIAALLSIAAVQSLVHNVVLVCAIGLSAIVSCLLCTDRKRAITFVGILTLCLISFAPYLVSYSSSTWSQIIESRVTLRALLTQLNFAEGNPHNQAAWLWHVSLVVFAGTAVWLLYRTRSFRVDPQGYRLFFGVSVLVSSIIAYFLLLAVLSYLPQPWYYLALLSILAVALEFLAIQLSALTWIRVVRIALALVALVVLPINAWTKITERQTNIDVIANKVTAAANSHDLIVVTPWQYGISFNRYYRGQTPWITLPAISDLRIHRYDLFREKMIAAHPIADELEKIRETLASGNRVWLVGGIRLPQPNSPFLSLPPAPGDGFGRNNFAYSESWMEQMSVYVRQHAEHGETVDLGLTQSVNEYENIPLFVVSGWQ